jgi:opine dehydrogenase
LREAVEGAEVIMIVTPATAHEPVARALAPALSAGQVVVLNPGRTGGALEVRQVVNEITSIPVAIAEAQTLLVASRLVGPGRCRIFSVKRSVGLAAVPYEDTQSVVAVLSPLLPQFYPASSILETSFDNMGAVFHPGVTLLNSARIESPGNEFDYYHEGVTPGVARVIEEIDNERVLVAQRYGVKARTAQRWLEDAYGASGRSLHDAILRNTGYSGIRAPENLDTRYIWEDVPMSLVPISEFGRIAGVPTPTIDGTISLCSAIHGIDYRSMGRTASRMGIQGMSPEEVLEYARTGTAEIDLVANI